MVSKIEFVEQALTWQGVPYHHQQYSRHGADCIGWIVGVGLDLGYDWRSYDLPERTPQAQGWKLVEYIERLCPRTALAEPGDLLVFRVRVDPQHCGLVLNDHQIIHSSSAAGKVTVVDLDQRWREHIVASFILPL